MAWHTNMITMLRHIIDDTDSPYEYADEKLKELLCISSVFVITSIDFSVTYTVDIGAQTITPDPVDNNDTDFQVLVVLKAACTLVSNEYKGASSKAISVRDGPGAIDARGVAEGKKNIMDSLCNKYNDAILAYKTGNGLCGHGIVGPYDIYGETYLRSYR